MRLQSLYLWRLGRHQAGGSEELENTQKVLKDLGLPAKIFEAHCPYVINKLTYPEIMCKFTWDKDILGNTLYFNYLKKEGQKGSVVRFRGYDKWKYNGEDVINYNDGGLTGEFKTFIRKRSRKNANMKEMKFKYKTKEEKQHGGKTKQRRTGG
jgi:hypothetical protein